MVLVTHELTGLERTSENTVAQARAKLRQTAVLWGEKSLLALPHAGLILFFPASLKRSLQVNSMFALLSKFPINSKYPLEKKKHKRQQF